MNKYFFASANSGIGFLNYFSEINKGEESFMYIIKGGSGTGKSSMMRKIGEHFETLGYDIEYFYCSTDINSLDGIKISDYNVCIVDGTAPHCMDSKIPGVTDKIINVGQYISNDVVRYKKDIQKIIERKKRLYDNMYLYLNSANKLIHINRNLSQFNEKRVKLQVTTIFNNLNLTQQKTIGNNRNLFLASIQGNGTYTLFSKNKFSNIIKIKGSLLDCDCILRNIKSKIVNMGYSVISLWNVIEPTMLDYLYIPQIDTILLGNIMEENECIKENNKQINLLINKAGTCLKEARKYHCRLEKCYVQNVDFCGIDKLTEQIIFEIENMRFTRI